MPARPTVEAPQAIPRATPTVVKNPFLSFPVISVRKPGTETGGSTPQRSVQVKPLLTDDKRKPPATPMQEPLPSTTRAPLIPEEDDTWEQFLGGRGAHPNPHVGKPDTPAQPSTPTTPDTSKQKPASNLLTVKAPFAIEETPPPQMPPTDPDGKPLPIRTTTEGIGYRHRRLTITNPVMADKPTPNEVLKEIGEAVKTLAQGGGEVNSIEVNSDGTSTVDVTVDPKASDPLNNPYNDQSPYHK